MKVLIFLSVLFFVNTAYTASPRVDPLVLIPQGLVRGQKDIDGDHSFFLGIPYAQVDFTNPFGPAQPHTRFEEVVFNAFDGSIRCPQTHIAPFAPKAARDDVETLDCLRLNIYVPNQASSRNPLPVLVWIHGGAFASGYAGQFHPRELVKQGIIVVTINYRLGVYGFMCLDTPSVPGNQGLKDQNLALRWIRQNIGSFGGNPYNVTIGGQSAGSCSVLLHLYSAKDKLFHKVIAESGTPQNEGMFVNGDVDAAVKLAQYLGLDTTDKEQALDFLATTPPGLVTAAAADVYPVLRPCREKSFSGVENFVESDPFSLSNERKVRNTPILIGHTSKEHADALGMYGDNYFRSDPFYDKLRDNFNLDDNELTETARIVRHFYIGDEPVTRGVTSALEEFDSDFIFNHPVRRTINSLLSENANPLYEYLFSYVEGRGAADGAGAGHSAELGYLFDLDYHNTAHTEENLLIINRITTLWANFVKYGNPTPSVTEVVPVRWQPAAPGGGGARPYLVIDTDVTLRHRVYRDRMAFWDLFYSTYAKSHNLARACSIN